ncbi:hypothetical protein J3F83DRAFT_721680 [Trichoderma novae-zelandiae]
MGCSCMLVSALVRAHIRARRPARLSSSEGLELPLLNATTATARSVGASFARSRYTLLLPQRQLDHFMQLPSAKDSSCSWSGGQRGRGKVKRARRIGSSEELSAPAKPSERGAHLAEHRTPEKLWELRRMGQDGHADLRGVSPQITRTDGLFPALCPSHADPRPSLLSSPFPAAHLGSGMCLESPREDVKSMLV